MMKNGHLPKISILLQFGDEIKLLALSCYSDSIHLEPRQNYKDLYGVTEAWKGILQQYADFWQGAICIPHHVLS